MLLTILLDIGKPFIAVLPRILLVLLVTTFNLSAPLLQAAPIPTNPPGTYPTWWFSRGAIVPTNPANPSPNWPTDYPPNDDYTAINAGQFKYFAKQAYQEILANAPNTISNTTQGQALQTLVNGWTPTTGDDYAAINLGQLKNATKPFYDVLILLGIKNTYPWTNVGADDYTMANIGQLKQVFDFQFSPVLNILTNSYANSQTVTLTPPSGQTYYYTLDGSNPLSSGTRISVTSTSTLTFTATTTLNVASASNNAVSDLAITVDSNEALFDAYNRRPRYLLRPVP